MYEEFKVFGFVDENDIVWMEFFYLKFLWYDFIEMNKIDYGKFYEKSYCEIKYVCEEESRKFDKIFIYFKLLNKIKKYFVKFGLKFVFSKF